MLVDFSKTFDSLHREKMEQILQVYGLPEETVTAIMILYKNTKTRFTHLMAIWTCLTLSLE